jgi:HSP20 family protein
MVERFGGRFLNDWSGAADALAGDSSLEPKADLYDEAEGLTIEVELPGVGPREVNVLISGDAVVVEAERNFTRNGRAVRQLETSYGRMRREFQLPMRAIPSKALAELRLGMLRIFIPRRAETATETLQIETTGDDSARSINIDSDE